MAFYEFVDWKGWVALAACLSPYMLGFVVPRGRLFGNAWRHGGGTADAGFRLAVAAGLIPVLLLHQALTGKSARAIGEAPGIIA